MSISTVLRGACQSVAVACTWLYVIKAAVPPWFQWSYTTTSVPRSHSPWLCSAGPPLDHFRQTSYRYMASVWDMLQLDHLAWHRPTYVLAQAAGTSTLERVTVRPATSLTNNSPSASSVSCSSFLRYLEMCGSCNILNVIMKALNGFLVTQRRMTLIVCRC